MPPSTGKAYRKMCRQVCGYRMFEKANADLLLTKRIVANAIMRKHADFELVFNYNETWSWKRNYE